MLLLSLIFDDETFTDGSTWIRIGKNELKPNERDTAGAAEEDDDDDDDIDEANGADGNAEGGSCVILFFSPTDDSDTQKS